MLTAERLRELLTYDPVTGEFRWLVSRRAMRKGALAGSPTGGRSIFIMVDRKRHSARRLAVLYMTGAMPEGEVLPLNGNHEDLTWRNMRVASQSEVRAHGRRSATNTTGYRGVSLRSSTGMYRASLGVDYKVRHLGYFSDPLDAARAYDAAALAQYGEFAQLNFPDFCNLHPPNSPLHQQQA